MSVASRARSRKDENRSTRDDHRAKGRAPSRESIRPDREHRLPSGTRSPDRMLHHRTAGFTHPRAGGYGPHLVEAWTWTDPRRPPNGRCRRESERSVPNRYRRPVRDPHDTTRQSARRWPAPRASAGCEQPRSTSAPTTRTRQPDRAAQASESGRLGPLVLHQPVERSKFVRRAVDPPSIAPGAHRPQDGAPPPSEAYIGRGRVEGIDYAFEIADAPAYVRFDPWNPVPTPHRQLLPLRRCPLVERL